MRFVSNEMSIILQNAFRPIAWSDLTSWAGKHNEYAVAAANMCLKHGLLESVESVAFDGYGAVRRTIKGGDALASGEYQESDV